VSFAHSRFSLTLANPFCHSEPSEESAFAKLPRKKQIQDICASPGATRK
jgi:hypothetical protein